MYIEELQEILSKYGYCPHYAHRGDNNQMIFTFLSVPYHAVQIDVTLLKLSQQERIVLKVQIEEIEVTDIKDLQPSLNKLYKLNKKKEFEQTKKA